MSSSVIKQLFSVQPQPSTEGIRPSHLLISSFILTALLTVLTLGIHLQPIAAATHAIPNTPELAKTTTSSVITPAQAEAPATHKANTQVTVPENCTPASASDSPSGINTSGLSEGLNTVIDTPSYYRVFGNTSTQIQDQLRSCAPRNSNSEVFAGETSYTLTWQYTASLTSNGVCTVNSLKIGLHVTMSLPTWSPTAQVASGLTNKWQNFISGLHTHENGHVALDVQYANLMLDDLQNAQAADCTALGNAVQSKATSVLANLDTANTSYDSQTNHGATQGAILP